MKIIYIATEYMDRRLKYAEVMAKLGHEVHLLQLPKSQTNNEAIVQAVEQLEPDLVFTRFIETFELNSAAQQYINSLGIPIVLYGTYQPRYPYEKYDETIRNIDFPFLHSKEHVEYFKNKDINAYYMPIGFYVGQYFDTSHMPKKYDVSFAGNVKLPADPLVERRIKYIQPLKKYGVVVFGARFRGVLKDIPVYEYSTHEQQRAIYGHSKINLDIPNVWVNDGRMHIKNRFFEIPATNNFLLELKTDEFLDIFDEDTIGYYEDSLESLEESIERYLADDKLRTSMALKSHQLVHEKHTFMHRFQRIFEIIENGGI